MISHCRAKSWIIQLKEENGFVTPTNQRGLKGNIIIFPQKVSFVIKVLPPSLDQLSQPVCVIFVVSSRPSDEWLRQKVRPLTVQPAKVWAAALMWLNMYNKWYKDLLQSLPEEFSLPVHIEHVVPDNLDESLTTSYDQTSKNPGDSQGTSPMFKSILIADVNGNATVNELRAAAMCHIKKGSSYAEILHKVHPVNEFFNPSMFPMSYPTLFPFGIGGFEDHCRACPLLMKRHIKHLLLCSDRRFQQHYSFTFTVFNILQQHKMLLLTALKTKTSNFSSLAKQLASIPTTAVSSVAH
ncbi:hypothetical protein EV368DRAFT_53047 [Lentinula lateritia]|nr:hypothetical protein EV368DRAFT_53047 [Lentinula lateritia]